MGLGNPGRPETCTRTEGAIEEVDESDDLFSTAIWAMEGMLNDDDAGIFSVSLQELPQ